MFKIIARYVMEGEKGFYEFFQEVKNYQFDSLVIPDNCFVVMLQPITETTENIFNGRTFHITPKPIEQVFYIGKEVSVEELKEKCGDNPKYQILIGNVERNGWRVVLDRAGKPRVIDDCYDSETIIEVVQM